MNTSQTQPPELRRIPGLSRDDLVAIERGILDGTLTVVESRHWSAGDIPGGAPELQAARYRERLARGEVEATESQSPMTEVEPPRAPDEFDLLPDHELRGLVDARGHKVQPGMRREKMLSILRKK